MVLLIKNKDVNLTNVNIYYLLVKNVEMVYKLCKQDFTYMFKSIAHKQTYSKPKNCF